jgi:nucleotide-binding universal stress UspA family protein
VSYRTILVQLNDVEQMERSLTPAVCLARRFGAHLIGLHVSPGLMYVPPLPSTRGIVAMIETHERHVSDQIRQSFERATAGEAFVAEWRHIHPSGRDDVALTVMQHVRAADLVVASQPATRLDATNILDFPERLAVESGRPVLLVPRGGSSGDVGRRILIAWNGSREATRATFDALPLLATAEQVTLLGIVELGPDGEPMPLPDAAIASTLARHGAHVTIESVHAVEATVGAEVLARVESLGADLLIMGAYGHTRLHEFVFGGATRHVARHATVPTLLSH